MNMRTEPMANLPPPGHGSAISVRSLRKSYETRNAVDGLDLAVSYGEVFALLGPNGAGKRRPSKFWRGTGEERAAKFPSSDVIQSMPTRRGAIASDWCCKVRRSPTKSRSMK